MLNPDLVQMLMRARSQDLLIKSRWRQARFEAQRLEARDTKIEEALAEAAASGEAIVFRRGVAVARLVPICQCDPA